MITRVVTAAVAAIAVAAGATADAKVSTDAWRTAAGPSYLVSHPPGWHVDRAGGVIVLASQPVLARTPPHRVRLRREGAYVWIFDYGREVHGFRREDGIGRFSSYDCGFGTGYKRLFTRDGHTFHAFSKIGPRGDALTRATIAAVLDSVRVRTSIRWGSSRSLGTPDGGALVNGVRLPPEGVDFFTWDPIRRVAPNRAWRRFGNDRIVRIVLDVLRGHRRAHPGAPRVGIGDLSRPRGGDFGVRFGWPGHVSHQNGLDVDVFYPRLDRRERPPDRPTEIDRVLAQDLVDRFVRAGAIRVFVGPRTGLRGHPRVVQTLPRHDNHLHARFSD